MTLLKRAESKKNIPDKEHSIVQELSVTITSRVSVPNSAQHNHSWEANSSSISNANTWNLKRGHHVQKGRHWSISCTRSTAHVATPTFFTIYFDLLFQVDASFQILHVLICSTYFSSLLRATCLAHLIPLSLMVAVTYGEEYKWFSSSLCSFSPDSYHFLQIFPLSALDAQRNQRNSVSNSVTYRKQVRKKLVDTYGNT
jgi:hypothetical protein